MSSDLGLLAPLIDFTPQGVNEPSYPGQIFDSNASLEPASSSVVAPLQEITLATTKSVGCKSDTTPLTLMLDQDFADATDMVGPMIQVLRPSKIATLWTPQKGSSLSTITTSCYVNWSPTPIDTWYRSTGVIPSLEQFIFLFKLTKGTGEWASYASLSQRSSKLFTSKKKGSNHE
ncbi:unnamed protein product [Cuscuta campestris]|uniref:Uncharacterized protein n=1 Tax=Cuscuta campestris TaxID=132261 RepID=A0A484KVA6_9ASTE|nr:unnamed protein product [Cuscuta campestris]